MELNFKFVYFITVFLCIANTIQSAKINTPRVLLPWFPNLVVNFTFEIIEGGCYTWSLSRDDIIDLEPIYEDSWGRCSRTARVSVSKTCVPPGSAIIFAEEVNSGEILRGDVDINKITSLNVMSTTWKLYLEEAPEAFEVVANDDLGNTFSTLEGVSLTWTVENVDKNMGEAIVKLINWSDTDYESPKGVTQLEDRGLRSHSVLLYGQAMGEAKVIVCLDKICSQFNLQVVANVVLTPAVAIIAPGDTIRYKVVRARAGKLTVQDVVDTLYVIELPTTKIATLEDSISLIRGSTVGTTSVNLFSGITEVATATLTVSEPHSIKVILRPSNVVVRGELFTIHCSILDSQGRYLTAGDEIVVKLDLIGDAEVIWKQLHSNGTLTEAVAHTIGDFVVNAKLVSIAGEKYIGNVEGQAVGKAIEPLEIVPPELYIAYTDSNQVIQLQHRGGGEEPVEWSEANNEGDKRQFSLTPTGSLSVRGVGEIMVLVQLKNYPHIKATGRVISAVPEYLQVTSSGQARVGKPHYVHVSLTGLHPATAEYLGFHRCNCASFITTAVEGPELQNIGVAPEIPPIDGACCVIQATWSARGLALLSVRTARNQDSCRVRVRSAPRLLWPKHAAMLFGHSVPVLGLGEGLVPESQDQRIAELTPRDGPGPIKYPDVQLFTMKCKKKGDTNLRVTSRSDDGDEFVDVEVSCAGHVARVRLEPPETPGNCSGGPRLWLRPGHEVALKVVLLDVIGRELLDEYGHSLQWDVAPFNRGIQYKAADRLFVETHPEYVPVPVPNKYYQVVIAEEKAVGWSGTLTATIPDATASIKAKVVSPLKCDSAQVHIAWEGELILTIAEVTGGSGRYAVESPKGVASKVEGNELRTTVPGPGVYDLMVTDPCIAGETQYVELHVEEVLTIHVTVQRALCVGSCTTPSASLTGASRRPLRASGPVEWVPNGAVEMRGDQLCARAEGRAGLRAKYRAVSSREQEILVFPPLSIVPNRIRLPIGGKLQLQHVGGPPDHLATIQYESGDSSKNIDVSPKGTLSGISLGTARVKLVARDVSGADMAVAFADVEVIPITGLRVQSATRNILVNNPCPLWLESSGLSSLVLAGLQPRVTWTVRDPSRARLTSSHIDDFLERSTVEGLAVRVIPLKPGPVVVDVKVRKLGKISETRSWDNTIELLAISDISTSVEGTQASLASGDRVAIAVGSLVRLNSLPRGNWKAYNEEGAFELTNSGELKGIKPGYGVVIAVHKDEKNKIYRETVVHIEVSVPHYCTAEVSSTSEDSNIRVVLRNDVGRALLAPETVISSTPPLAVQSMGPMGSELILSGLDSTGTFMTFHATSGGVTLKDEIWVTGSDDDGDRLMACSGWVMCIDGVGWRVPPNVVVQEGAGVTLAMLTGDTATKHTLKMDRPPRSFVIHQMPISKIEFQPGEWPYSMVPLSIEAKNLKSTPIVCSEQQKLGFDYIQIELPFTCRTQQPHTAEAILDLNNDQIGCSILPAHEITESTEVELCAEWGASRICTRTLLLPSITLYPTKVSLLTQPAEFQIHGHPHALKSVKITTSPGLKMELNNKKDGEIIVLLRSDTSTCGYGWVNVVSRVTSQEIRVEVVRECEQTCGSVLSAFLTYLRPHIATLITLASIVAGTYYVYKRLTQKSKFNIPFDPSTASIFPPTEPSPTLNRSRTWSRSPYAAEGPVTPIYGDTSILPDASYSPNNTSSRNHSRFL